MYNPVSQPMAGGGLLRVLHVMGHVRMLIAFVAATIVGGIVNDIFAHEPGMSYSK